MSEERARAQAMKFQNLASIMNVIDAAYDDGIKVFMCTTHERIAEICDYVRANRERYKDLQFYPCMPYAHKYANAATEHGVLEALRLFLPSDGQLSAMFRGGMSLARKDVEGMARLLIDAEMKMFHDLPTPVVFIQNIMTDLILGLGLKDVFRTFADHIQTKYNAEPGFITMNTPMLLDVLEECGIKEPHHLLEYQQDRLQNVRWS